MSIIYESLRHDKAINCFKGKLKNILKRELRLGNKIVNIGKGYPNDNDIIIILEKPFTPPIYRNFDHIEFYNTNDPHYWKASYYDKENKLFLACGFGGSPHFKKL